MYNRYDRDKFMIGTYHLKSYAQDEEHIRQLAECGIDTVLCMVPDSTEVFDIMEKYHIRCIQGGVLPGWWGGDGSNAGKLCSTNTLEKYADAAAKFTDHNAVCGIDIGDEPSSLDFEYYGKVVAFFQKHFPGKVPYLNLYPNYASVAENTGSQTVNQLGVATYEEYIERYVKYVGLPYISYDFYVYSMPEHVALSKMYENYRTVSDACLKSGRDMWYIPQCNGRTENDFTSENMLRFQMYTALCYGATVLSWACYCKGWWYNNVLDENGNKTEQYDKLKKINAELRRMTGLYMQYRRTATYLTGFRSYPQIKADEECGNGFVRSLKAEDGASLTVGCMVNKKDPSKTALVICNSTDYLDRSYSDAVITFESYCKDIKIYSGEKTVELIKLSENKYSFRLENCHGVILTAE